ncbi:hypothetical protein MRX96_051382, partial [Rhipicephalus microplus]
MCAQRSSVRLPLSPAAFMRMTMFLVGAAVVCTNLPKAGASLSPQHLYALALSLNASDEGTAFNKVDEPDADGAAGNRHNGGRQIDLGFGMYEMCPFPAELHARVRDERPVQADGMLRHARLPRHAPMAEALLRRLAARHARPHHRLVHQEQGHEARVR